MSTTSQEVGSLPITLTRAVGRLPWDADDRRTLVDFAALLRQPSWMADALCREPIYAEVDFHPDQYGDVRPALEVCGRCLVQAECLAWVEQWEPSDAETHGVWGGLSARERKQRRKARRAAA